ncbi:MAG: PD-(D/E)XK nuclease family protein [Candidatus Eremiobacteraeota bacterium]|nr:PD-(D/E)XK nuclease family protein [Candidatus Eremiobacteraeota bacterium]
MFFRELIRLANHERTRQKWVWLPYAELKWKLGERLLLAGVNWLNFRFVTPFEVALEMAAPTLLAQGINPKPEELGPSLVDRLLGPGRFQPLLPQPGMAEALWSTLNELRREGVHPAQQPEGELRDLHQAYLDYLDQSQLADRWRIFELAQTGNPVHPDDLVLEFPHRWSALERRFIDRLGGRRVELDEAAPSQLRIEANLKLVSLPTPHLETELLLHHLDQAPFDHSEVVVAEPALLPLVRDRLLAQGLPFTLEMGFPVSLSRPGRALMGLLTWVEHDFSAYDLRQLLSANLLDCPLGPGQACWLLETSGATWGKATYRTSLEGLALRYRARGERDPDQQAEWKGRAEQALALIDWVEELAQAVDGPEAFGEWVTRLSLVVERVVGEASARTRLKRALSDLGRLESAHWTRTEAIRHLRQQLGRLHHGGSRPLPGHVHVTDLDRCGLGGRGRTFVVGLADGGWIPSPTEDPVLPDSQRQALGMPLAGERAAQRWRVWLARLAGLQGEVVFSRSCRDLAGDELPASRLFSAARRQASEAGIGSALASPAGWWLAHPHQSELAFAHYAQLRAGREADRARQSERFTEFDGLVVGAAGHLDPRQNGKPVSVSRLQVLATCPFRYFLEQGLGLTALEARRPRPDEWLDPATRGTLLHQIYADYHRFLRAQGRTPHQDDLSLLMQYLARELEATRRLLPPFSAALEERERRALRQDLEHFLELEILDPGRPVGLEVGFGLPDLEGEELARPEPVMLDLGDGLRLALRGRIDRIDEVEDGYRVIDYKTGRSLGVSQGAVLDRGRLLQHALYSLVVEDLVKESVVGSLYYFPTTRAKDAHRSFGPVDPQRLRRVLELVLEPVRDGHFAHSHEPRKDCTYCDFKAACSAHEQQANRLKLEQDERLASRRRLLEEP